MRFWDTYNKLLVAVGNTPLKSGIVPEVKPVATTLGKELVVVHEKKSIYRLFGFRKTRGKDAQFGEIFEKVDISWNGSRDSPSNLTKKL
jgi:hypothetical protein